MTLTTKPLVLIGENLKVMAWMVFGAPDQNAEILVRVEELLEVPLGVPLEAEAVMEPVPTATRPAFVYMFTLEPIPADHCTQICIPPPPIVLEWWLVVPFPMFCCTVFLNLNKMSFSPLPMKSLIFINASDIRSIFWRPILVVRGNWSKTTRVHALPQGTRNAYNQLRIHLSCRCPIDPNWRACVMTFVSFTSKMFVT